MQSLDETTLWDRIKNILINLCYLFGDTLSKLDLEFLQKLLQSFFEGWTGAQAEVLA
jgi:hypothetical protein